MGVMTHSDDSAQGFTELEMGFGTHFQSLVYDTNLEITEVWHILHTSECLMVDVPCLDHLWDSQKDHHSNEKIKSKDHKHTK